MIVESPRPGLKYLSISVVKLEQIKDILKKIAI